MGDQLRSVDNTFTSLSIFIPSSRPSWAFILFCKLFSPRPLKAILAVSLSHPRFLNGMKFQEGSFKSQTLISLVLFLAMKISSQGYSPDSCWSVLLRILALLGGLFPFPHLSGCPQLGYAEIINLAAREEGRGSSWRTRGPGLKSTFPARGSASSSWRRMGHSCMLPESRLLCRTPGAHV